MYGVGCRQNRKGENMYYNYYDDNDNNEPEIDFEQIKSYFEDYYGTAVYSRFPVAIMDVFDVQSASDEELLELAEMHRLNLNHYLK